MSDYEARTVDAADVVDLRTALLRRRAVDADTPPPTLLPGDEHPNALHVAAFHETVQVGIASIHPEPMPHGYRTGAWRIHDVAMDHGHRGLGIGAILVERCLEHAAQNEARAAWCLAPAGAFGFFDRYGFQRSGDPYEGPEGPGYLLYVELGPLRRSWSI
jgi:GNAT superfamily N-acetyltransferase